MSRTAAAPPPAGPAPDRRPVDFHRRLPGYAPTPVKPLAATAERLGLRRISAKDETRRFGLPAFKILGASWAVHRELCRRLGLPLSTSRDEVARRAAGANLALVAATDGNHGRAVARVAAWLGLGATIFVPSGTAPARISGIGGEGARVEEVPGTYDQAVRAAAALAVGGHVLIQDTGRRRDEAVPGWVAEGYHTLFAELEEQLADDPPELLLVPVGVGALAEAAVRWLRRTGGPATRLVAVEPSGAACLAAALREGRPVTLAEDPATIMAGLACGTVSAVAWPWLRDGLDGVVTVDDDAAEAAVRALAAEGIEAGETGAAALAGLVELAACRAHGAFPGAWPRHVVVLVTEGPTDPLGWARIVGRPPG